MNQTTLETSVGIFMCAITGIVLAMFTLPLRAGQRSAPDLVCSKKITFELKEHDDSLLSARSDVFVEYTFLSEKGSEMDEYNVYESYFTPISNLSGRFNSSKLSSDDVFSRKAESEDVFLTEDNVYTLRVPEAIAPGDHFSFQYRQKFEDVAFIRPMAIPNVDSMQEFRIEVQHPEEYTVTFEFAFPADSFPCRIEHPDDDATVLRCGPFRGLNKLIFYPYNASRAFVLMKISKGAKQVYPLSPAGFLAWYAKKTNLEPRIDSARGDLPARSIDTVATTEGKLRVIHDYIRSTMRYIADARGENAIVPRDPGLVADRKYGDCKDRAALASAIARRHGLEVSMALLSTDPAPEFSGVASSYFNHMICAYTDKGRTKFFDPTAKYCEFGNVPDDDLGARALILDPRNPRWERIELPSRRTSVETDIVLSADSLAAGTATITLRNDAAAGARHARNDLAADVFERYCQQMASSALDQVRLFHFRFVSESDDGVVLRADADCSRFIIRSGAKYYVPRIPFLTSGMEILERDRDSIPLYFSGGVSLKLSLTLTGVRNGIGGEPLSLATPGAGIAFSASVGSSPRGATAVYDYYRMPKLLAGERKTEYIAFLRNFLKQKKTLYTIPAN